MDLRGLRGFTRHVKEEQKLEARIINIVRERASTRAFVSIDREERYHEPGDREPKIRRHSVEEVIEITDAEVEDVRLRLEAEAARCRDVCASRERALAEATQAAHAAQTALDAYSAGAVAEELLSARLSAAMGKAQRERPVGDAVLDGLLRLKG